MTRRNPKPRTDRVTYRDLRNTPSQVWERLANRELLTLVAGGEPRAILVPVVDGDVNGVYEAYVRGRSMLAAARLRRTARQSVASKMTLKDINELIRTTRETRRREQKRK
jgi:antitoxin (DNA-binding transcriptional repressor) of toxin-antitoxin stability system